MPHSTSTVYRTESLGDAQRVWEQLAAQGIVAVVVSDPLDCERGAAAGPSVRVEVATEDEAAARRVAGRFEYQHQAAGTEARVLDDWPRCPDCNAPRITCCPVCQTAGHDFPQADPEFSVVPGCGAEEPLECGCGGCSAAAWDEAPAQTGPAADAMHAYGDESELPTLLTCTTCDEPFVPRYLKRCEWCGHTFSDGIEFELPDDPVEALNGRVVFVFVVLAASAIGVLAWLAYML